MWPSIGQQTLIPTPTAPKKGDCIGAVNHHTGEVAALVQRQKHHGEVAALPKQLLAKRPAETIDIARDSASIHRDGKSDGLLRAAAAQLFGDRRQRAARPLLPLTVRPGSVVPVPPPGS